MKAKHHKNLSPEQIAEALEEPTSRIVELLTLINAHPDADAAELYHLLGKA